MHSFANSLPMRSILRRPPPLLLAAFALLAAAGCKGPEFYEKQHYGRVVMDMNEGAAETHFYQKVYYSMEGSAGGIGTTAGGGCGCY